MKTLCNLPVFFWLFWGERLVPLRQVRRAMNSWFEAASRDSTASVRSTAETFVTAVANPKAPHALKSQAVRSLARAARSGRFDGEELSYLMDEVMRPDRESRRHDPTLRPESPGRVIKARWAAAVALRKRMIHDELWQWARAFHIWSYGEYLMTQTAAASQTAPPIDSTLSERANSACISLLTILGLGLLGFPRNAVPPLLDPTRWKHGTVPDLTELMAFLNSSPKRAAAIEQFLKTN